jgi:DNA-binding NarL/FixJ family response regulator
VTIRVFIVEDQKHLQGLVADLLKSLGDFTVAGSATTEAEANLWLDEHGDAWDLAVVDLVLDQGTGMGVIPKARRRAPGATIVVFSDYASPGIEAHCRRLGADAVVSKGDMQAFIEFCGRLVATGDTAQP